MTRTGARILKIVVVGLFCATLVAAVGLFAHVAEVDAGFRPTGQGRPTDRPERTSSRDSIDRVVHVFGGDAGKDSTARPVNSTGPVGAPVGEPPFGSSETA